MLLRAIACSILVVSCTAQQPPASPPPKSGTGQVPRQQENRSTPKPETPERWNLYWQATTIPDYHGTFHSPYQGTYSLRDKGELDASLTSTLYFGLRLAPNTQIYVDPELAGGDGFSNVNGIANFPNGELPRVASVVPTPYIARTYIQQDFGWGDEMENVESEENQLAGQRPLDRYTVIVGRFSLTDFFDDNRYSHDPRTQFMGWAAMYNGAWDYPADTRGYTNGFVNQLHTKDWTFSYGSALEPLTANGMRLDWRITRDRGDIFQIERRWLIHKHQGAIRPLGFLLHSDSGSYQEALDIAAKTHTTPAITETLQPGRLKYGGGVSFDQEITANIGVFARLGWSDGHTESFAFTPIDRLAESGVSVTGSFWRRPLDAAGSMFTASGLSAVHAAYLAAGGLDFMIGDGRLNYAPEYVWESYYSARLAPGVFTSFDLQYVSNPAYNHDRGPVWVEGLRLHIEMGK
jgi:high affinity Mn2+ porin